MFLLSAEGWRSDRLSGSALTTHDYQQEDGSHASGFLGVYMAVGNESAMRPEDGGSGPFQEHEAERVFVLGPGSWLSREISRQSRKSKSSNQVSALGARMHFGEVDALGIRQHGAEYVLAADHHDLVDPGFVRGRGRRCASPSSRLRATMAPGATKPALAREHDVEPASRTRGSDWKVRRPMMTGLPSVTLRNCLRSVEQPPGQIAADADGAVLSPRHDEGNDGIARRAVALPLTRRPWHGWPGAGRSRSA